MEIRWCRCRNTPASTASPSDISWTRPRSRAELNARVRAAPRSSRSSRPAAPTILPPPPSPPWRRRSSVTANASCRAWPCSPANTANAISLSGCLWCWARLASKKWWSCRLPRRSVAPSSHRRDRCAQVSMPRRNGGASQPSRGAKRMGEKTHTLTLTDHTTGKRNEQPVRNGTEGPPAVDIGPLYRDFGYFTYDPGFVSTASCRSSITYIDGEQGVLLYRGYPIEQLAEKSSFIEVAYLLLYGDLPNEEQLDAFNQVIVRHTMINKSLKGFYQGFYHDAHPMATMVGVVGSLSAFYHDSTDIWNQRQRESAAHRLIAKRPTIAAASYKHSVGEPFGYPMNSLSYAGNFLRMLFAVPSEEYEVDPVAEKALDLVFILHADHEQNASTSTVRLAGSSGANPFACIASGIAALWGPAHGGANEAVLRMLDQIGGVKHL